MIYGYLNDKKNIIITIGNNNNILGALIFKNDKLQFTDNNKYFDKIVEWELNYLSNSDTENKSFSLYCKKFNMYLFTDENNIATLSTNKKIFNIGFSSVDKIPRQKLLSGVLYNLYDDDKLVKWNMKKFSHVDLISFLPTTYYSLQDFQDSDSQVNSDSRVNNIIIENETIKFLMTGIGSNTGTDTDTRKKFTEKEWVKYQNFLHCEKNNKCGKCLGNCNNDKICVLRTEDSNQSPVLKTLKDIWNPGKSTFICVNRENEFSTDTNNNNNTKNDIMTIIVLISIIVIIALLIYGKVKFF
jgi:hypothetical protein